MPNSNDETAQSSGSEKFIWPILWILLGIVIEKWVGVGWWRLGAFTLLLLVIFITYEVYRKQSLSVLKKLVIGISLFLLYLAAVWWSRESGLPCLQIDPNEIVVSSLLESGEEWLVLRESRELFVSPEIDSVTISIELTNSNGEISCKWLSPLGIEELGSECRKKFNIVQAEDQSVVNVDVFAQDCKKPFHEYVILRRIFQPAR